VATDFRLWVRDQCDAAVPGWTALIRALLTQAEAGADWVMPGFTHLQTAQPVTWGHHMMAYVEMFARPVAVARCPRADERMPAWRGGAGRHVLSHRPAHDGEGAGLRPADAQFARRRLDRDFALEFLAPASICAMHLSRASPRSW
jgi:argininosuccinate lyase